MATEEPASFAALLAALKAADWGEVLSGVGLAETWLRSASPGDQRSEELVSQLVQLANHPKWEIRRAVANAAAQVAHPAFESVLAKLLTDDNTRVRQAAEHAALRRRDWRTASALGKQHEGRINASLDDIEVRFGPRARDAVKRASEQIANTFARELYHEVIRLLSPLAMSADRLRTRLSDEATPRSELAEEAARIERRVSHLRAVLSGMRAYTELPSLAFEVVSVKDVLEEAVSLVREAAARRAQPPVHIQVDPSVTAELSRPRFVQALTNVLMNAVESYDGINPMDPIIVRAEAEDGRVTISVEDKGCGMSTEAVRDAAVLFVTSKPNGTGFGLPLAIKIVESEHLGRLNIDSARSQGTVVRMIVPAQRPQEGI